MENVELRPLSLGELLDRTFHLYRNHFWLFVSIMAMPSAFSIPVNALILSFQGSMINGGAMAPGRHPVLPSPSVILGAVLGYVVFFAIFISVYSIAVAAAVSAVSDVYLGRQATVRGAYGRIRGKFWRLIGVVLNILFRILGLGMAVFGVGIGGIAGVGLLGARGNPALAALLVLLIFFAYIAGVAFCVYFALRYAVSVPVLMLENLSMLETIRRSIFLTRGRRGHIFGTLLVALVIAYVGVAVFQGPFIVVTMLAAMKGHWPPWLAFASAASGAIGGALTGPISMIAIVLLYYDARIRKEAFDLQFMMASIDHPSTATAPNAVSPA
jgi:Membrane domain of glycerophosphoryl diester phosphodiesterase